MLKGSSKMVLQHKDKARQVWHLEKFLNCPGISLLKAYKMHFCYCAGINSQSFAVAGGSGNTRCGNGQKFSGSGMKKTVTALH